MKVMKKKKNIIKLKLFKESIVSVIRDMESIKVSRKFLFHTHKHTHKHEAGYGRHVECNLRQACIA